MNCKFNVPGKKRKELAQCIAQWLGCDVNYKGAPSFAYEVDYFTTADQTIADRLEITFLGEDETAIRLGIKSQFGDVGLV